MNLLLTAHCQGRPLLLDVPDFSVLDRYRDFGMDNDITFLSNFSARDNRTSRIDAVALQIVTKLNVTIEIVRRELINSKRIA